MGKVVGIVPGKACKEMSDWLRQVRCTAKLKEWWPTLQAKLRKHYQYYGKYE